MRIGLDLHAAESAPDSPTGGYARALVEKLTSRFAEHEWFAFHHAGAANGQVAMEQAGRDVDLWLTTCVLDPTATYVPPSAPTNGICLAGLLYDLAPALVPDRFLQRPGNAERYRRALLALPRYDLLLTVSEATRQDCLRSFEIDESRVVAIGPACDHDFSPCDRRQPPSAREREILGSLGIRGPFALCLAGDEEDRSLAVWTAAVERLSNSCASDVQFVIACKMPERRLADWRGQFGLRGLSDRILIVDPASADLRRLLYQRCELMVDASPHEGSGLGVLHALQCGAAAVVDWRSPHLEVAASAAVPADVDQPASLSAALARLLGDVLLLDSFRRRAPEAAGRFQMEPVATRAMEALLGAAERVRAESAGLSADGRHQQARGSAVSGARPGRRQPPLAFFSPLLPLRSGIADYSQRLLAVLKHHFWIDLYHDHDYLPELGVSSCEFACRDHRLFDRFQRATEYAGIVYQMANTHMCAYLYDMLLRHPGVVVLHDYALPEFHFGYALRPAAPADFIAREIALESPELGEQYRTSADAWRAEPGGIAQACLRRGLAFNRRVLEAAAVIVVHDPSGAKQIAHAYPHLVPRVRVIPHGANLHLVPAWQKPALRERYGFKDDELILSCFGFLNGAKYHSEVIEAVGGLARDFPSVRLVFVGSDLNEGREQARAAELGLGDRVRFFGHAPMETFLDLMSITDLAMNLRRPPTRGETSGALLTLLSAGVPTIVTDVDTFSSYPDAVVKKIGPLSPGDRSLEEAMRGLLGQPERRADLGQSAMRYVAETHDWRRVASLYAEAVDQARTATGRRAA
ncbi:MAG TPA: glycosyltransferase [Pirellulales bacterium]|nr:glycosyltransferase [Pirellulales bacterium]